MPSDDYGLPRFVFICDTSPVLFRKFKQCLNTVFTFSSDASLIGNYDIKRCYEVDILFHYHIAGGLTSNTTKNTKSDFSSLFNTVSSLLTFVPECSGVITTREEITASPPGVTSIFFKLPIVFTASNHIPDNQVSSNLTSCINAASGSYKGFIDNNIPSITQSGATYKNYNSSTISDKTSCCGGDIPPPCCATGSIKVSSTKCGKELVYLLII